MFMSSCLFLSLLLQWETNVLLARLNKPHATTKDPDLGWGVAESSHMQQGETNAMLYLSLKPDPASPHTLVIP
jgi:hypothetical protein